jgi:protein-tyrosine phosphatase
MYEIRPWLFVGGFRDSNDAELLARHRIGALLQLAAPVASRERLTLVMELEDGEPVSPEALARGVEFIAQARAAGLPCLVACGAGISRSVLFATAALHRVEGLSLLDAATAVKGGNPGAVFHPVLWESLTAFARQDVSFREVLLRLGP